MTQYTLKTTPQEAEAIAKGNKSFVFRGVDQPCGFGDYISFQVVDGKQMKRHAIERMKFVITYVGTDAPIERGFKVLGFRRVVA